MPEGVAHAAIVGVQSPGSAGSHHVVADTKALAGSFLIMLVYYAIFMPWYKYEERYEAIGAGASKSWYLYSPGRHILPQTEHSIRKTSL